MTRRLIILLLLAHVAVAFWAFGPEHVQTAMWGTPGPSQREPERWAQQRRPEAIVVVTPGSPLAPSQAPAAPVAASEAASAPAVPVPVPALKASSAAPASAPAAAPIQGVQRQGRQDEAEQPPKP
jgi:hypothetical protein